MLLFSFGFWWFMSQTSKQLFWSFLNYSYPAATRFFYRGFHAMQLHYRYLYPSLSILSFFSIRYCMKDFFPLLFYECIFCYYSRLISNISPVEVPAMIPLKWPRPWPYDVGIANGGHSKHWISWIWKKLWEELLTYID